MRRFLASSAVALWLTACGTNPEGTKHDDEDTQLDPGGKPGKSPRLGFHDAGGEDEGSVDGAAHEEPMGSRDSGTGTQGDSGEDPQEPQPKDTFAGLFEVTTTYRKWSTGCVPSPITTTVVITKLDVSEYNVLPSKATRFVVNESWYVLDASTLSTPSIDEVAFTATGFTGTYNFGGAIPDQQPGPTGTNCSYSGYTLQGVRK